MPYREKQREAVRKAVARKRNAIPTGITESKGITGEDVIPDHLILAHLVDPGWRLKMVKIIGALERRDLTDSKAFVKTKFANLPSFGIWKDHPKGDEGLGWFETDR